ncbi:MAG: rhomboid family intramembrane serine protease, partial [Blastocatellia bacterium]
VHIGLLHLIMNSYVLWTIGPLVEKLYGSARFMAIYLLTAAGGSLASFINHSLKHDAVGASAGASGAIFGLFGVLAVFSYRYRSELPERFLQALKSGVLPAIGINLLIGFSLKYVDNAAHIGGLLTGALLALVVPYIPTNTSRRVSQFGLALLGLCVAVILTCFALTYWRSAPLMNRRHDKVKSLLHNIDSTNVLMVKVFRAVGKDEDWKASPQDISELAAAAEALQKDVAPDAKTEKIRLDMIRLVHEQKQIIGQPGIEPLEAQLELLAERFMELHKTYVGWVKTEGPTYDFELRENPKSDNKK